MGQRDKFDPLYQALIEHLVRERKNADLTQADVASRMGTDQSNVSKFERCERRLDVVDFVKYCRAIGIDAPRTLQQLLDSQSPR